MDATQWFGFWQGLTPETRKNLLETATVLLGFGAARWLTMRIVHRRVKGTVLLYQWRKSVTYATAVLALAGVVLIWFPEFHAFSTYLGLLSAGLAIALQDLLVNLAGWLFILWRRPFQVGDRIEIAGNKGDVIDIRLFQFTLLEVGGWVNADQSTGRIVHVPNGKVFREPQANYSRGFQYIWHEIPVMVTFESNWREAKEILTRIVQRDSEHLSAAAEEGVKEAARRYMIFYENLKPIVYTSVADSGVVLTMRFLCDPRKRRATEHRMWEDVLTEFARRPDVDFAYPSVRYYDNVREGKPGAGGAGQTDLGKE